MTIEDVMAFLAERDGDFAHGGMMKARLQKEAPNLYAMISAPTTMRKLRVFPVASQIYAAQCSLFDNYVQFGGKRPNEGEKGHDMIRFKITVDVWTGQPKDLKVRPCYSSTSPLLSTADIIKKAKRTYKGLPKVSPAFRDSFVQTAQDAPINSLHMGMFFGRDGVAKIYQDDLFCVAAQSDLLDRSMSHGLIVFNKVDRFTFTDFSHQTSKGNPLPKNCVGHSRMTRNEDLASGWNAAVIK